MAAKLSDALMAGVHYEVFEKQKTITLNEEGARYAETALDVKDLYDPSNPWAAYVVNAIKAKALFNKDKEYVVKGEEVMIVDEFSGRILDGRRCADGHGGPRSLQPCAPSLQPYASQVGRRPAPGHGG